MVKCQFSKVTFDHASLVTMKIVIEYSWILLPELAKKIETG